MTIDELVKKVEMLTVKLKLALLEIQSLQIRVQTLEDTNDRKR